jgi:hypothetical protein
MVTLGRGGVLAVMAVVIASAVLGARTTPERQVEASHCFVPLIMGDLNGSRGVTSTDALWILREKAGLFLPDNGVGCSPHDIDCNGLVSAVDALKILRHIASLEVNQVEPCPDIGTELPP